MLSTNTCSAAFPVLNVVRFAPTGLFEENVHSTPDNPVAKMVIKGFDNPHYYVDVCFKPNCCFASWKISLDGEQQMVWVDKASFKKRFNKTAAGLTFLLKSLPSFANKDATVKSKAVLASQLPVAPQVQFASVDALATTMATCTKNPLHTSEIEKFIAVTKVHFPQPNGARLKAQGLARSLIINSQVSYALMTHVKTKGDILLGKGLCKLAKYAVNLRTAERKVVVIARKHLLDPGFWNDIQREFRVLHRCINQRGIIQIEYGIILKDKAYFILEDCNCGDLKQAMKENKLSLSAKLRIALESAEGVSNLHLLTTIHRDLKPGNIFLIGNKDNPGARIADFGLSCFTTSSANTKQRTCGTPRYFAPEHAKIIMKLAKVPRMSSQYKILKQEYAALVSDKIDVWAMGCILFQLFHPRCALLNFQNARKASDLFMGLSKLTQEELFKELHSSGIEKSVIAVLEMMLQIDPTKRCSMDEAYKKLMSVKFE